MREIQVSYMAKWHLMMAIRGTGCPQRLWKLRLWRYQQLHSALEQPSATLKLGLL